MGPERLRESRHAAEIGRVQRAGEGGRDRPLQARQLYPRHADRARAQRRLLGRQAALAEGDVAADLERRPARRGAPRRRRRRDREPADPGFRQDQGSRLPDRPGHLEPHHLSAHGPVWRPGLEDAGRQGHGQEPLPRQARARGGLEGDQPAGDRRAHHGRRRGARGRAPADAALRHVARHEARRLRSGGSQEAPRRGRLSERLRGDARHAERPLHQRREDRAGGGADARPASASRRISTR